MVHVRHGRRGSTPVMTVAVAVAVCMGMMGPVGSVAVSETAVMQVEKQGSMKMPPIQNFLNLADGLTWAFLMVISFGSQYEKCLAETIGYEYRFVTAEPKSAADDDDDAGDSKNDGNDDGDKDGGSDGGKQQDLSVNLAHSNTVYIEGRKMSGAMSGSDDREARSEYPLALRSLLCRDFTEERAADETGLHLCKLPSNDATGQDRRVQILFADYFREVQRMQSTNGKGDSWISEDAVWPSSAQAYKDLWQDERHHKYKETYAGRIYRVRQERGDLFSPSYVLPTMMRAKDRGCQVNSMLHMMMVMFIWLMKTMVLFIWTLDDFR